MQMSQDKGFWIIPCSPSIYDAEAAFKEYGSIVWHQDCNIQLGDVVFIYVTAPIKEIRCKCIAVETDIPFDIGDDDGYVVDDAFCARSHRRYMNLQLKETYSTPMLGYQLLLYNGLNGTIRSQRRVSPTLQAYIIQVTGDQINADD